MPLKHEHVVPCSLSRRQRFLYDEFMSRTSTRSSISSGSYMHIINILMQLRKVCNHPNLFAEPDVGSPVILEPLQYHIPALVASSIVRSGLRCSVTSEPEMDAVNIAFLGLCLIHNEVQSGLSPSAPVVFNRDKLASALANSRRPRILETFQAYEHASPPLRSLFITLALLRPSPAALHAASREIAEREEWVASALRIQRIRADVRAVYGYDLHQACAVSLVWFSS